MKHTIQLEDLPQKVSLLGRGGQSVSIHRLDGSFSVKGMEMAVKIFNDKHPVKESKYAESLPYLVNVYHNADSRTQQYLDKRSAWPIKIVADDSERIGCLFQVAPPDFFYADGDTTIPLSMMCESAEYLGKEGLSVTHDDRLKMLSRLARYMYTLHDSRIVINDMSGANFLISKRDPSYFFAIDCDSYAHASENAGGVPILTSPSWEVPNGYLQSLGTSTFQSYFERDRYKLALMILRVLGQSQTARSLSDEGIHFDLIPAAVVRKLKAVLDDGSSISPKEWENTLSRARQKTHPSDFNFDGATVLDDEIKVTRRYSEGIPHLSETRLEPSPLQAEASRSSQHVTPEKNRPVGEGKKVWLYLSLAVAVVLMMLIIAW